MKCNGCIYMKDSFCSRFNCKPIAIHYCGQFVKGKRV